MQKPAPPLLFTLLVAAGLLPGSAPASPLAQQHQDPPQQRSGHPAPAGTKPRSADLLNGQEFREHVIRDSSGYDPKEAAHDIEVGHFYRIQGDYRGALSRFQSALRHNPRASDAMYEAGETELALHQPDQARSYFQQYLAADPQGRHAHSAHSALKKLNRRHRNAHDKP